MSKQLRRGRRRRRYRQTALYKKKQNPAIIPVTTKFTETTPYEKNRINAVLLKRKAQRNASVYKSDILRPWFRTS